MDIDSQTHIKQYIPHPESIQLRLHSYGFGGVRYNNIVMLSQDEALIPIGACIARWDLRKNRRVEVVQTNTDSIFVLLEISVYIISISHSGNVSILDRKNLDVLRTFRTKGRLVRHASVSTNFLCIICEEFEAQKGITEVYSLTELLQNHMSIGQPQIHFSLIGRYRFGTLTNNGLLVTFLERLIDDKKLAQTEEQINSNEVILSHSALIHKNIEKKHKKRYYDIFQYDLNSKELKIQSTCPYVCEFIQGCSNGLSIGSYLYQDRHILIIDLQTLNILSFAKIGGGKGSIMTQTFTEKNVLLLFPAPNLLLHIQCDNLSENQLPEEVKADQLGDFVNYKVSQLKSRAVHHENYFISLSKEYLFVANEAGFISQNLDNPRESTSHSGMNITCCGLATNSSASMVAVGDFIGNVYIYSSEKTTENDPIFQTCVMSGVRSLDWDPSDMSIAIGTIEGSIFRWYFQDFSSQPQLVSTLKGSITRVCFKQDQQTMFLMASTTEGQFGIFEDHFGQNMKTILLIYGHLPQQASEQFGSLDQFAEIWSCIWSCKNANMIATASEDQKVNIFDLQHRQPLLLHELKGHTLAVTAIDWKIMNDTLGEVFASCSDDKTIRIYSPNCQFEFQFLFSTSFIREWHTLTYLALEEGGSRVAIGSQCGYLFIYDLVERQFKFSEKIHMGGIEGLVWGKNRIFTCSSDCCINVIDI